MRRTAVTPNHAARLPCAPASDMQISSRTPAERPTFSLSSRSTMELVGLLHASIRGKGGGDRGSCAIGRGLKVLSLT